MSRRRIRKDELRTISSEEFKRIRKGLGLSQAELAGVLGYGHVMRISELERETNPIPVPWMVAQLMLAMNEGYRPETFVVNDPFA
jgi:transcriptional regulator with XRE-family HTH domain